MIWINCAFYKYIQNDGRYRDFFFLKKTHDGKKSLIFSSQMAFYIGVHFIPNRSGENKNNSFIRCFSKRVKIFKTSDDCFTMKVELSVHFKWIRYLSSTNNEIMGHFLIISRFSFEINE